jgi:hypothetical protein
LSTLIKRQTTKKRKTRNYSPCNFRRPKPKAKPTNVITIQTTAASIISLPILAPY